MKNFAQHGDIVFVVRDSRVGKYTCHSRNILAEKHLLTQPIGQNYATEWFAINGLEEYVFDNWFSAKIYQIKQVLKILKNLF